jgi:hypothetical protein
MQDFLLGRLVHRQQANQPLERLSSRLTAALCHLSEQPPDLGVLIKQHGDHVGLAGLIHRFILRSRRGVVLAVSWWSVLGYPPAQAPSRNGLAGSSSSPPIPARAG